MDPRRRLLETAHALLASVQGQAPDLFTVEVRAADGSALVTVAARPGEFARAQGHDLSDMERAVLAAATAEPRPVKQLASLAGYAYSPHLRRAVAKLLRLGLLLRTPDGCKLPSGTGAHT